MKNIENRIYEIAQMYNAGRAKWLTKMALGSNTIRRSIKLNIPISDDTIHGEISYYEDEYEGDCFEDICFGTNYSGTNPSANLW